MKNVIQSKKNVTISDHDKELNQIIKNELGNDKN